MKTKELMIGDWVKQKHSGLLLKVCAIEPPYVRAEGEDGHFHEDTIEPIEITTEFLEKNFARCGGDFGIFDVFYDLYITNLQDGMWTLEYHSCEFNIPYQRVHVSWVHELQHFLTHCGIDKGLIMKEN